MISTFLFPSFCAFIFLKAFVLKNVAVECERVFCDVFCVWTSGFGSSLAAVGNKNVLSVPSFESAQPKALGTCHPNLLPNFSVV